LWILSPIERPKKCGNDSDGSVKTNGVA